jgi:hypothetical protein
MPNAMRPTVRSKNFFMVFAFMVFAPLLFAAAAGVAWFDLETPENTG